MVPGLKVATVGGGPAGSFFALYLMAFASQRGLSAEVDVYEPRDFSAPGPLGCNRCAGILSGRLLRRIGELGLTIPERVIQGRINAYSVFSPFGTIEVTNPEPGGEIYSIYRGGGPLHAPLEREQSFDRFLLDEAVRRGARWRRLRVQAVRLVPRPAVLSSEGWQEYGLVALCCGLNSARPPVDGVDYRPPPAIRMSQDELVARPADVARYFGSRVKVFVLPASRLIFGTLVPKGSRINVSLLGQGRPASVSEFLDHPLVARELPFPYRRVCGCQPLISVGMASHPYADGLVAVGDAGVTRLYKDGIGSALFTAREAARAAVYHGVSADAFHRHYAPLLASVSRDNAYGRAMFWAHQRLKRRPEPFLAHGELARREQERGVAHRPFNQVLWDLFTGGHSYGHTLRTALAPGFLVRLLAEAMRHRWRPSTADGPLRIVVLGAGFGGVYTTLRLERSLKRLAGIQITLVNRDNFFLFAPLLHEVATGGIETRHIALPIRALRGRRRFRFVSTEVQSIDLDGKRLITGEEEIGYDYLVLAPGGSPDITGSPEFSSAFTLKTLYDGIHLRNHIIGLFEDADARPERQAELLTFVVVGGGAVGVQVVAEIRDFVFRHLLSKYPGIDRSQVRVLLVNPEPRLLPDMDAKIAKYAGDQLQKKGIEIRFGSRLTRVWDTGMELDGREIIPTQTVVWSGGIRASPLLAELPVARDELGRVMVDRYLGVPGFPGVYALGDAAHFADPATGRPLPARAHIAVRQPRTVAGNIVAELTGGRRRPFSPPWMADMVSLGSHSAALKLFGLRVYGFPARVLWLSGYLALLPHNHNRIRVAADWLLSLFFGRDTTLLRLPFRPPGNVQEVMDTEASGPLPPPLTPGSWWQEPRS
ncbi:MAG: FAD-dependent oxidoreductase [Chloroflexi bacterium]|nr:FAD-dependent oxidoreductase [Chloroflexota bacterium]